MQTANVHEERYRERQSVTTDECLDSLKYRKAIAKTAFTKARNQVLRLLEEECINKSNRSRINEACKKLSIKEDQLMEIFEALVEEYLSRTDRQNKVKTIEEIEKMEQEFSETLNQVQRYLNNTFSEMFHGEQSPKIEPTARRQLGKAVKNSTLNKLKNCSIQRL